MDDQELIELRVMKRMKGIKGGTYYLELRVRSRVRPGLKKLGIVELSNQPSRDIKRQIAFCAATMAEELGTQYGDNLDPSAVAGVALEAFDELMSENPTIQWGDEPERRVVPSWMN